ncbi:MAG: type II toxin-antitoxin system Phd/YefM family antitoxin [Actinobacteria bacterium]|nr:type II toxin-antitoxin system Phd/YefM family antitoxin [Actinomycetota bacterium]MBU1943097.1 type II toxin-antitoxin system Phd/YefM family antitoxin [Actinomycetota bacterium]MBU2687956.1 type II toxin-antitoxin system Phd/YefM family antitoxin [Actinomycetota bacterium]
MGYSISSSDMFVGRRKFREGMTALIKKAHQKKAKIIITDRGRPDAVCMPIEEYEALMEYLDDVHDRNVLLQVARSRREIESGEAMSLEELKGFLEIE